MALDGLYLYALSKELRAALVGCRVDKIGQPTKNEILLSFRTKGAAYRLLFNAAGNAAGAYLTETRPENPAVPPMFTMLLRKNLQGALLTDIRQHRTDRILFFDFDATNEIGDRVKRTLIAEIMAQYSNAILTDGDGKIIDSIKRVDLLRSSVRQILPGLQYTLPPSQNKLSLIYDDIERIAERICESEQLRLDKAIGGALEGVSPVLARELALRAVESPDAESVGRMLSDLKILLENGECLPNAVFDKDGKPVDFSFLPLTQYDGADVRSYTSLSALLDEYYRAAEQSARVKSKAEDLKKLLSTLTERLSRKISEQQAELAAAADREGKRIFGDLINANLYTLEKGALFYDLDNFYDNMKRVRIPADPRLTPAANAQKYYKEYRKAANAEKILTQQLAKAESDLDYLLSVKAMFDRAETEREFSEIREELTAAGFIRSHFPGNKKMKSPPLPLEEFTSPNGFRVLVGRNNLQNDRLSFRTAAKADIWFHVQKFHGSHVILVTDGKEPLPEDYVFAAKKAVEYSEVSGSEKISVDYTLVKNLIKPTGARPGFVIYHVYKTIVV